MKMNTKLTDFASTNGYRKENGISGKTLEDNGNYNNNNSNYNNNSISFVTEDSTLNTSHVEFKQQEKVTFTDKICSWRYAVVILLHLSFMMATFARNCMPIALVCMTQTKTETDYFKEHSANTSKTNGTSDDIIVKQSDYEFSWNSETQGIILSSSSFLSFLAPLIANFIQPYFGHKNTLTATTLTSAIILFLIPSASRLNPWLLVSLRIILGGTFGANVPVISDTVARWAPAVEKQTMITIIYSGLQTGGIFCSLLSGYLCMIPIDNGWPFIFYTIGAIIFLWVIFWHFFSSVNPEDHKYISQKELQHIKRHRIIKDSKDKGQETERPPYKSILTSVPVIALMLGGGIYYWSVTLIFTYMPIYIVYVLDFSVTETGVIMTCFSVVRFLSMGAHTILLNKMMAQKTWSPTAVKKSILTIGTTLAAASHVPAILFNGDQRWIIMVFFVGVMFFQSSMGSVFPAIPLDLAPRYAGCITGLLFSLGGLFSISAPIVAATLTPNNTAEEWQKVWIIASSGFLAIGLVFLVFGDCRIQPWAKDIPENAPEVVSPFDPMRKRFSAAMETSPVFSVGVNEDRPIDLSVNEPVKCNVFTTENSCKEIGGTDSHTPVTDLGGISNDGFESELDHSIPRMTDENPDDDVIDIRF